VEQENHAAQELANERRRKLRAGAKRKGQMGSPVRPVLAEWTIDLEKGVIIMITPWKEHLSR
jgi:hypothetical protein